MSFPIGIHPKSNFLNADIVRQLGISVRTLESYCVRITDKLNLQGIKELRRPAIHRVSGSTLL